MEKYNSIENNIEEIKIELTKASTEVVTLQLN